MAGIDRTIGKLEKSIETLEGIIKEVVEELKDIKSQRDKAAGALKAVMIIGAIVSPTFGAIGALAIDYVKTNPPAIVEKLAEVANVQ